MSATALNCNLHNNVLSKKLLMKNVEKSFYDASNKGHFTLINRKLKILPTFFAKCNYLDIVYIDISNNRFSEIPKPIGQCIYLETLICCHNTIRVLPDWLPLFTFLQYLDVSHNTIGGLPHGMMNLTSLQVLYLQNNRISSLPQDLCVLDTLAELDVSHNYLSALPAQICQLCGLRILNLRNNKLTGLIPEISQLSLTELDVSENMLHTLPPEMHSMHCLESLHLDHNPLQSPPSALCAKGLRHILKHLLVESIRQPHSSSKQQHNSSSFNSHNALDGYLYRSTRRPSVDHTSVALTPSHSHSRSTPSSAANTSIRCKESSPAAASLKLASSTLNHDQTSQSATDTSSSGHHLPVTKCSRSASTVQFTSSQSVMEMLQSKSTRLQGSTVNQRIIKSSSFSNAPGDSSLISNQQLLSNSSSGQTTLSVVPVGTSVNHSSQNGQPPSSQSSCVLQSPDAALVHQMKCVIERRLAICLPDTADGLVESLKDGVVLCYLANQIAPQSITGIHVPPPGSGSLGLSKSRRNIESFLGLCRRIGLPAANVFMVMDLMSGSRGLVRVARTVLALDKLSRSSSSHSVESYA